MRPSLDNLVGLGSPEPTISTPGLAWTPVRHRAVTSRAPHPQAIHQPRPPGSWITGPCHKSQSIASAHELLVIPIALAGCRRYNGKPRAGTQMAIQSLFPAIYWVIYGLYKAGTYTSAVAHWGHACGNLLLSGTVDPTTADTYQLPLVLSYS